MLRKGKALEGIAVIHNVPWQTVSTEGVHVIEEHFSRNGLGWKTRSESFLCGAEMMKECGTCGCRWGFGGFVTP